MCINTKMAFSDVGLYPMDIKSTANTLQEWFIKLYNSIHPIFNPTETMAAPMPTHFRLQYTGFVTEDKAVVEWDLYHNNIGGARWVEGETVDIIWLLETGTELDKLVLGVSPVMTHGTLA